MRRLGLLLLLALLLALPVRGEGTQEALEEALEVESVEEAAGDLGAYSDFDATAALQGLLAGIPGSGILREAAKGAAGVLLILLCCAGVDSLFSLTESQLSALNLAGAAAVEVGAANLTDPFACRKIIGDLPSEMDKYGIERLSDIIGGGHGWEKT